MRIYTVYGLYDEESRELYVTAVVPGRHMPEDTAKTTFVEGYGEMTRFTGFFEADSADEAELIAVDVVAKDDTTGFRDEETVDTGGLT